ncbi:hypothetical protein VTJ04DRAFT_5365 [Mycothermus thermophilus]|uniref:uncharacterized protein n=1 Tax=Humicola insolens TaxID=85995 RepID=UPI00374271D8
MFSTFILLLSAAAAAVAGPIQPRAARTSPPPGCLVVGGSGQYRTVQSAVDALSKTSTSPQCIFIYRGTYREQVYIPQLKSPLSVYGETTDTSHYWANTVTITQGRSQDDSPNNDATATLRAHTPDLKVYNINFVNTRGKGSQALALSAQKDRQGYYACQFKGFQDTVYANDGTQVYARSYIEGATDFIFGQRGKAWFDGVDIAVVAASTGYITANGRDSSSNPSYFVINRSSITARQGDVVNRGAYYLGRPWRAFARVVFQDTFMTNVVNSAGWAIWNNGDPRTSNVEFDEYRNLGEGANGARANFARKLSSPVRIETVLGNDYRSWVDTSYLS